MAFMWYDNAQNNMTATTAPTAANDVSQGYTADPPSLWYDTVTGNVYVCVNNTAGAATWIDVTVNAGSNPTFTTMTVTGDGTIRTLITSPEQSQNVTAAGDTVVSQNTHVHLVPDADYVLSATPTIQAGVDGQWLIIHNTTNFTLDFQDDSVLAGSDIFLGGGEGILRAMGTILFHYNSDLGGWSLVSNPNTASAGANADILEVRNQSGVAIAAGKAVYVSGWNVGQNRPLIALADANNAATMPAIGFTSAAINNGANGQVITTGSLIGLIDTSVPAVGAGVWVSTTPGEVVFNRPGVDEVQRIGTVTRSNAAGNIFVIGAGRTNDVPIDFSGRDVNVSRTLIIEPTTYFDTREQDFDFLGSENDFDTGGVTFGRFINDTLGSIDITGLVPYGENQHLWIVSAGAQDVRLRHQDGASVAENRFLFSTGGDITLNPNDTIHLIYDFTTLRWRDF